MSHQEMYVLFLAFAKMFGIMGGIALLAFVLMVWERHREIKRMQDIRKDVERLHAKAKAAMEKGTKL